MMWAPAVMHEGQEVYSSSMTRRSWNLSLRTTCLHWKPCDDSTRSNDNGIFKHNDECT